MTKTLADQPVRVRMTVVHVRTGYVGVVREIKNGVAAMKTTPNSPWKRARLTMLRPATRQDKLRALNSNGDKS